MNRTGDVWLDNDACWSESCDRSSLGRSTGANPFFSIISGKLSGRPNARSVKMVKIWYHRVAKPATK